MREDGTYWIVMDELGTNWCWVVVEEEMVEGVGRWKIT